LIPAVWTFLGVVVVTLGTIAVQALKSRPDRSTPPASPTNGNGNGASLLQVARDVARDMGQLDQRANDNDERDDVQDRHLNRQDDRIEALERYNDHRDPDWRRK
jgi:hypothetical protein